MKSETYFLLAILIAMVAATVIIINFPFWQAKLAPLTVTLIIVILGAVQLKREISATPSAVSDDRPGEASDQPRESPRGYLIEGVWMISFFAGIYLLGLLPAILFFGIAYMKAHGASLPMAVIVTASVTCFAYIVFSYILQIRFYQGVILSAFLG